MRLPRGLELKNLILVLGLALLEAAAALSFRGIDLCSHQTNHGLVHLGVVQLVPGDNEIICCLLKLGMLIYEATLQIGNLLQALWIG